MSAAMALRRSGMESRTLSLFDEVSSGEPTLADHLAEVCGELATKGTATCPVCGAVMHSASGGGDGRCTGCGSTLS